MNIIKHDFEKTSNAKTESQIASELRKKALKIIARALRKEKGIALLGFTKLALDLSSKSVTAEADVLNIGFSSKGEEEKTA